MPLFGAKNIFYFWQLPFQIGVSLLWQEAVGGIRHQKIWGCVKSLKLSLAAEAAKLYSGWTLFFQISFCEIRKNNVHPKLSFAAEGSGILFTQPQVLFYRAGGKIFMGHPVRKVWEFP